MKPFPVYCPLLGAAAILSGSQGVLTKNNPAYSAVRNDLTNRLEKLRALYGDNDEQTWKYLPQVAIPK